MTVPPATVFVDLAAEVPIPNEGTLSKVLYKDQQIRVVAFAFDIDQELTDHSAAVPATIRVVSGKLEVVLDGKPTVLGPNGWVHMPAHLPHAVRALQPSVMLLTLLQG